MNSLTLSRCALGVCAAAMLLVGCGGLQPAGVTQGPVPQGQMPENPSRVTGVRPSPRSVRHASVTETVLHSFRGYPYDGRDPSGGLTYFNGTFYGTTSRGGSVYGCPDFGPGCGTVYSITPSGTETVLYSFKAGKDGASPNARLIVRNGTFYGTTAHHGEKCRGGGGGCGVVFSMTPSGHETVLYEFAGPPDGSQPEARLLNVKGTLYGTTFYGGSCGRAGCGTVFSITPGGKEKVLHSFAGPPSDGSGPSAGLTDVSGTLYGTTGRGGTYGGGTVFSITPGGKEKVLHSFGDGTAGDGAGPYAGLIDVNGTLYGVTGGGGAYADGTVFSIKPSGSETVLHSFTGPDGYDPDATLLNVNGTLYGTTAFGGVFSGSGCETYGCGTVFSITPSGYETVLYSFKGGKDGETPDSGVIDVNGTFYGTTTEDGAYDDGTVYSITL